MEKYCPKCYERYAKEQIRCPNDGTELITVPSGSLAGKELDGRYRVLEVLGKGGMGVVYIAEQHVIGRRVALKVLKRDLAEDDASVRRFLIEAKAIANLRNQHTITLYDFGVTSDGQLFYTMELLAGQSVSDLIKKSGPLPYERACSIIFQVLESLEEAHGKQILHRDLKPDNLNLNVVDGKDDVTVLDFGIAKLAGDQSMGTVTKTGMICGTPHYLSPEQVMGNKAVPASDLYSLGIVLYEMLAGKPPFHETTPMKLLLRQINDIPMAVSKRNPHVTVPSSIERFIKRALVKDPNKRYPHVAAFRAALLEALENANDPSDTVNLPAMETTSTGLSVLSETTDELPQSRTVPNAHGEPSPTGEADASARNVGLMETLQTPTDLEAIQFGARQEDDELLRLDATSPDVPVVAQTFEGRSKGKGLLIAVGVAALATAALLVWSPWSSQEAPSNVPTKGQAQAQTADIREQPIPETESLSVGTLLVDTASLSQDLVDSSTASLADVRTDAGAPRDTDVPLDDLQASAPDSLSEVRPSSDVTDISGDDVSTETTQGTPMDVVADSKTNDVPVADTLQPAAEQREAMVPETHPRSHQKRQTKTGDNRAVRKVSSPGTNSAAARDAAEKAEEKKKAQEKKETSEKSDQPTPGLKFKSLDEDSKKDGKEPGDSGLKFKTLD